MELTAARVEEILDEHHRFFHGGKTKDTDFRIRQMEKLAQVLRENEGRILQALREDLHKSAHEAFMTETGALYSSISYAIKHLKSWTRPRKVKAPLMLFGSRSAVYPEPYGTVLIIGPYNYPVNLVFEPLIGAVAAGNCAVVKPSEMAPAVSSAVTEMLGKNFDQAYIRVIEGERETTAQLVRAPFDYIFFTGSPNVGRIVMEAVAHNLVPVTLELGGKSPCIVDETADIDKAAKKITWGKFCNAGQTCIAPDYAVVHHRVKPALLERIKIYTKRFFGENPRESSDFGRIINTRHTERIAALLRGGNILLGGQADIESRYIAPTVLGDAGWEDPVMQEEIFGPVLPVLTYDDLETLISRLNSGPKPLGLYLFTKDKQTEKRVLSAVSFGGGCVNDVLVHAGNPYLPFGGGGNSGTGSYHGKKSFDTFSHEKSVLHRRFDIPSDAMFPPYTEKKTGMLRRFYR